MGFNCGIVGLPNVGKSTIFSAITSAQAEAANYPFCTIEPNIGIVNIPDERLNKLSEIVVPEKVIPTTMEFVDIAGLVKGASKGEGLGNKFLSHIRSTDAIAHVLRCFDDENVTHVSNTINPVDDLEIIELELIYADLESCDSQIQRVQKKARMDKELEKSLNLLLRFKEAFEKGIQGRLVELDGDDIQLAQSFHFITSKQMMYVCNVSEKDINEDNEYVKSVKEIALKANIPVVKICGKIEAELSEIESEEEKSFFLDELGIDYSGLDQMISTGYKLLGLKTYFTAGVKEVRAWTYPDGFKAPQTAGVIHTDFERGFIKAEVISYEDFVTYKGEAGAKENGKLRLEGKDYLVKDGDVMHFRFNV